MINRQTKRPVILVILFSIGFGCSSGDSKQTGSAKYQQYFVQGEELYKSYCANCHQTDGTGLGRVYPPLNESDFMTKNFEDAICIIKNGRQGELWVNGVMFNQPMKSNPSLTELEVAEIATYIYNTWSDQKGIIEVTQVAKILASCPTE